MLTDPQVVTYAAAAKSLPAISRGEASSEYKLNDGGVVYDLIVSHQFKARNRVNVKLRRDSYAPDPVIPTSNVLASMSVSFTMDFPTVGIAGTDVSNLAQAMVDYLTDPIVLKLINGET